MPSNLDRYHQHQAALSVVQSIHVNALVKQVRREADARPYHAATCVYAQGDQPKCIVGTALHHLGVSVPALTALGSEGVGRLYPFRDGDDHATAVEWLMEAQHQQDMGATWSDAVRTADERHPLGGES